MTPKKELGFLEIKCPYSKRDMTIEEILKEESSYLYKENDEIKLLKTHGYYY